MDTMEVAAMSDECSVGPAWEVQAVSLSKGRTVLIEVVFIEWRRKQRLLEFCHRIARIA